MAQVPVLNGPSVPESAAPTPLQNVQAPPSAFGATVAGEGLTQTGQATQQTSDALHQRALEVQAIYNKQAADTAGLGAATAVDQMVSKWRQENQLGKAVATYPQLLEQIEQTRQGFGEGLTPLAKADFEQLSRRFTFSSISQASNYAAEEGRKALVGGADANAKLAVQLYATNPTPENEALMHEQIGKSLAQQFSTTGLAPDAPQVRLAALDYMSKGYATVISNAYQSGNLELANQLLQAHKTDLTDQDFRVVSGSLRVANTANQHFNEAQAILDGGVVTPMSGSRAERNNNPLNLKGTDLPGQVGSDGPFAKFATPEAGFAAADRNLAAYGSQHGINTIAGIINRWAPPSENDTASYINTVSKTTGIAPDAKIDLSDPAIRSKILTAMERVESGPPTASGAPVKFNAIPLPQPGEDPNLYLARASAQLQGQAAALHPDNPAEQRAVFQAGMELAKERVEPIILQNKANYDTVSQWVVSNDVKDITQVQHQFPSEWAAMEPQYKRSLEAQATYNGQLQTPARQANVDHMNALLANAKNDPNAFLSVDPRAIDMSWKDQQHFVQEQDKVKAGKQGGNNVASTGTNRGMSMAPVVSALSALGFPKDSSGNVDRTSPEAMRFSGMLYADLEQWAEANPGKKLDDKTIIQQAAALTARVGTHPGFLGIPTSNAAQAQLQQPDIDRITQRFQAATGRAPEPWEIGYLAQRERELSGKR